MKKTEGINQKLQIVLWLALGIFGFFSIYKSVSIPSETENSIFFGLSTIRLLILIASLLLTLSTLLIAFCIQKEPLWWKIFINKVRIWTKNLRFLFFCIIFFVILLIFFFLILANSKMSLEVVLLRTIEERFGLLLIWTQLFLAAIILQFNLVDCSNWKKDFTPIKRVTVLGLISIQYFLAIKLYAHFTWDLRFRGMEKYFFLPLITLLIWAIIHHLFSTRTWYATAEKIFLSIAIVITSYTVFRHTSQWMNWLVTPSKTYWNLLADAFLNGRLYLINPDSTHDLTLYKGNWYVPNPPLPAFMLMPIVAMIGLENLNMVVFSCWLSAITVLSVFWLLETASQKSILETRSAGNLWVTAVFALGTNFWWLSFLSRMWYVSQIFTILFTVLAAFLVLKNKSPFWVGLSLGLAILARPNVFTVWLFLLGLYIHLQKSSFPNIPWKKTIQWSLKSSVPIVLAVGFLLYYNYLRFDHWLDFGYTTINGAEMIVKAVQDYGMFNPHFIPINFKVMFLDIPEIRFQDGLIYKPSQNGYNIFYMTPVLIYLFRRFKRTWWSIGAWGAILLSTMLLLMYHNTGAGQVGYRYLLDFIAPVLVLLAFGMGKKPSWFFKLLTVLAITGNLIGIIWWFDRLWC